MSISDNSKRRLDSANEEAPCLKRPSTSTVSVEPRFVALNTGLGGLSLSEPANFVACIIPKSLQSLFEKVLQETLARGLHTPVDNTDEVDNNQVNDLETTAVEFIHDFEKTKEELDSRLKSFSDYELRREVPREKFPIFRDNRKQITKWFVTGQHLVNGLVTPSESRKFLKTHSSFSPAVTDESTKQLVLRKLKNTTEECEQKLTHSVLHSAFDLNKKVQDTLKLSTDSGDSTLVKIFAKAYRSVTRKFNYLTKANTAREDDQFKRKPRFHTRNFYGRNNYEGRRNTYRDDHYEGRRNTYRDDHYDDERNPWRDNRRRNYRYRNERPYYRDYEDEYDRDYPPLNHRNTNYRRYKRNPKFRDEPSDDDEVFERDRRHQSFRD